MRQGCSQRPDQLLHPPTRRRRRQDDDYKQRHSSKQSIKLLAMIFFTTFGEGGAHRGSLGTSGTSSLWVLAFEDTRRFSRLMGSSNWMDTKGYAELDLYERNQGHVIQGWRAELWAEKSVPLYLV